jgi:hypothetical protein
MSYKDYYNLLKTNTEVLSVFNLNSLFIVTEKLCKSNKYQKFGIQFAAAITAKARVRLYKTLLEIQKNGGRLLYCDTDSYFVEYSRNVLGERHGEAYWDPNKSDTTITDAVFIAPKMYGLKYANGEVVKFKGISNKNITFDHLKTVFYEDKKEISFIETQLQKKNFKINFSQVLKVVSLRGEPKRKFNEFKNNTTPYTFDNGIYH